MKYIFGNWKMYLDLKESIDLAETLSKESFGADKVNLAVFPTSLAMSPVLQALKDSSFNVGAQNAGWTPKGAYTGAVSAFMFKEAGCKYVLVGHSERRYVFGESDTVVRKRLDACLETELIPVVCVGETAEEKTNNKREYRLKKQLMTAFQNLNPYSDIMVAYEPVWAIGTGDACNPSDADDVHGWLKAELKQYFNKNIPILYGGSVNADNVLSYLALETVDGVLVGGASSKFETFLSIIRKAESLYV